MFVNTTTGSIYIGDAENTPVEVLTVNSGPIDVRNVETFCGLTLDEILAKVKEEGIGGGDEPSTNPEWPALKDLTVGNIIAWANQPWIVSHKTDDACYLTLTGVSGETNWYSLQNACTTFASKFTEAQKACLKSVTAGNTSGKVFVATKDQMDGGFSYFSNDSRRSISTYYWTSTDDYSYYAWRVLLDGSFDGGVNKSSSYGFRPSVCIDVSLYT